MARVIGIAGWSGSGKTTLILQLLEYFNQMGLAVSVVKHAHHNFEPDIIGKDSYQFRTGGANQVCISSRKITMVIEEKKEREEPLLAELLSRLQPADLVIVEGFKFDPIPKLEIYHQPLEKPLLYPNDPYIKGVISDNYQPPKPFPHFKRNNIGDIAQFILKIV